MEIFSFEKKNILADHWLNKNIRKMLSNIYNIAIKLFYFVV